MKTARFVLPLALLAACASSTSKGPDRSAALQATEDQTVYEVIPVKYAVAHELAVTLRGALAQAGQSPAQIVADDRTNSLVVTCEPERLAPIERLIAELDIQAKKP